jgi:hypothetical protein
MEVLTDTYETRETANGPAWVDWRIGNQGGQPC